MIVLAGIAIKSASRSAMQEKDSILISPDAGVAGDFRGRPGKRQVTVLSETAWQQACDAVGEVLPWTTRRANLLLSGISFGSEDVGKIMRIGDVQLEITREADPCKRMDEARPGLKQALSPDWRGGVCCRVLQGGRITLGDAVKLTAAQGRGA
jgi:MOSC domain-containing protein YiiM